MATGQTKKANVIDPQVYADMATAELTNKIRFKEVATFGNTLQGQPGSTINIPAWNYIGDAVELTEGVAMDTEVMTNANVQAVVKEVGKAVEITDTAVLSGIGDPVGEGAEQVGKSCGAKMDADIMAALETSTLVKTSTLTYDNISDAIALFADEEEGVEMFLYVNSVNLAVIRKWAEFKKEEDTIRNGVVGSVAGAKVKVSNRLADTRYFLAKPGAVHIETKRGVETEADRDILSRTTVLASTYHYASALKSAAKCVKGTIGA